MTKSEFVEVMKECGFEWFPDDIILTLNDKCERLAYGKLVNKDMKAAYFITEKENFVMFKRDGFKAYIDASHLGRFNDEFGYYAECGMLERKYEPDSTLFVLDRSNSLTLR